MINTTPELHTLKNGIRLLTFPLTGTETITALVLVKVGSRSEQARVQGISHFLEHLFFKGTKSRPSPVEIAQDIESVGGYFNAFTAKEYTGFYITAASKDAELVFDILSDILTESLFDPEEIERERGVILEEMRLYFDTPSEYIAELFESLLYGDTPLGRDIVGTFESVRSTTREDVIRYINEHYTGENTLVTLAGKFTPVLIEKAKVHFRRFKDGKNSTFEQAREEQSKPQVGLKEKNTDQAHLACGVRTFGFGDKRRDILEVAATLLGAEKSSRMFVEVREKLGLAYYIYTESNHYADAGYLATFAGVNVDKIDLALETILKEYQKLADQGPEEKELTRTKDYLKGRLLIELESSFRTARFVGTKELLLNQRESLHEYFKRIDAVTREDIQNVAKEIFTPEKLNLAIIGPYRDKGRFEKLLKF